MDTLQQTVTIAAGRITAPRCQAKAKHSHNNSAVKLPCEVNVSVGFMVANLLVHALNKVENAVQRLRLYMGGKPARNVRYAPRSSVR